MKSKEFFNSIKWMCALRKETEVVKWSQPRLVAKLSEPTSSQSTRQRRSQRMEETRQKREIKSPAQKRKQEKRIKLFLINIHISFVRMSYATQQPIIAAFWIFETHEAKTGFTTNQKCKIILFFACSLRSQSLLSAAIFLRLFMYGNPGHSSSEPLQNDTSLPNTLKIHKKNIQNPIDEQNRQKNPENTWMR